MVAYYKGPVTDTTNACTNCSNEIAYVNTKMLETKPVSKYDAFVDGPYSTSGTSKLIQQFPIKPYDKVYLRSKVYAAQNILLGRNPTLAFGIFNLTYGYPMPLNVTDPKYEVQWGEEVKLAVGDIDIATSLLDSGAGSGAGSGVNSMVENTFRILPPKGEHVNPPPETQVLKYKNFSRTFQSRCNFVTAHKQKFDDISCGKIDIILKSGDDTQFKNRKVSLTSTYERSAQLKKHVDVSDSHSIQVDSHAKREQLLNVQIVKDLKVNVIEQFSRKSLALQLYMGADKYWYILPIFILFMAFVLIGTTLYNRNKYK